MVSNVESLPYAVFQVSENPVSSKDGVYRYDHGVVINVVAGSFDECKDISDRVRRICYPFEMMIYPWRTWRFQEKPMEIYT